MIDRSGEWWRGENFEDLAEYLRTYTAEGYPAERVTQARCRACGQATFGIVVDDESGCAQRSCGACGETAFIGDSEEYWEEAEPGEAACPCGSEQFEVGVAFSLYGDGEIRWITVGGRCVQCGVLGAYAEWKIDYGPTNHLFDAV